MDLLDQLRIIYSDNNQLVLFAEAKNAGLIALNVAIIIGIATIYSGGPPLWSFLWWAITYVIALNVLAAVIALSALGAQKLPRELDSTATPDDNYLFFGTVSHLSAEALLEGVKNKYTLASQAPALELDQARQAVIIAQIATRKFTRFNYALAFTMSSLVSPLGFLIYYFAFYPNRKG